MYKKYTKRLLDAFLALVGLIVLSPLFICVAVLIKTSSEGPVFFKQKRVGINKSIFEILKFRTMSNNAPNDCPTHLLENANSYITPIGKILRKTSLDELPQLINILKGEMSIIGPRPALWNQDDLIMERDKYNANSLRPGLTGWAQVNGRDELEISVKAKFDGEYVNKLSLSFDCYCFFKTFISVIKREGITEGYSKKRYEKNSNNRKS